MTYYSTSSLFFVFILLSSSFLLPRALTIHNDSEKNTVLSHLDFLFDGLSLEMFIKFFLRVRVRIKREKVIKVKERNQKLICHCRARAS